MKQRTSARAAILVWERKYAWSSCGSYIKKPSATARSQGPFSIYFDKELSRLVLEVEKGPWERG